jgi:hypothetical protein
MGDFNMEQLLKSVAVTIGVFMLVSCSDTVGPDSNAADSQISTLTLDVAMVSADELIEDVAELELDFADVIGGVFAEVDAGSAEPIKRSRTKTFYDADGNEQFGFNKLTTASVHILSEVSGEWARGNWSKSGSRNRDITITGLEGEETSRTVNGTGSSARSKSHYSDENGPRSYEMSSTSVITNVIRGVPRKDNPYPLSGTITRNITVEIVNGKNGDETRTKNVVVTFNGTQFASMTIDGEELEVDLSARKGKHPFRKKSKGPPSS